MQIRTYKNTLSESRATIEQKSSLLGNMVVQRTQLDNIDNAAQKQHNSKAAKRAAIEAAKKRLDSQIAKIQPATMQGKIAANKEKRKARKAYYKAKNDKKILETFFMDLLNIEILNH